MIRPPQNERGSFENSGFLMTILELDELQANLSLIAQRSAAIKSACGNEESTKLYLVLPVIGALGYDYTDPFEVKPEYEADFREGVSDRVDFAIMRDGKPLIAIECKKAGTDLSAHRGQLRAYFTALQSVRLGILTDGLCFEFFVDCENANIMDAEPFATLDIEAAASGTIPADVLEVLDRITRSKFDPEIIAETAEMLLVGKRLRAALMQEIREPSDDFCKFVLQRIGIKSVRRASIQSRYCGLIRTAIEEALVLPVVEALRAANARHSTTGVAALSAVKQRIVTTDRELAVHRYVCRRLAFLVSDEQQFSAIEQVQYRDYVGKFVVYYQNVNKGRLFDFIEGSNGFDKFVFAEPFGEIVTNDMKSIDGPLGAIFAQRVRELNGSRMTEAPSLRRA